MTTSHQCPDLFHPIGRPCCIRELERRAKRKVHQQLLNDPQFQSPHYPSH